MADNLSSDPAGRILVLWNSDWVTLLKTSDSKQHMHFEGLINSTQSQFLLTIVYGSNDTGSRHQLWDPILKNQTSLPWLVTGNFNCIRNNQEKQGSSSINLSAMDDSNEFINDASLLEMTTTGLDFTWCNNHARQIRCRLDRALISTTWLSLFPDSAMHVGPPC